MTVHVDELTSEVVGQPAPNAAAAPETAPWAEEERVRAIADRLARDAERTRAEGFDD